MSLLSPRPSTGVSAPWPPAPIAPLVSAGLLSLHRDLLRLCAPLERSVAEWMAQFETMSRITSSIEATMPRWRKLIEAQAALERRKEREHAEQQRSSFGGMDAVIAAESSTAIVVAAASSSIISATPSSPLDEDDDCYFAAAQPLHSSFSAAPSSAPGTAAHSHAGGDPDAALLASVGVLGCLPGHVAKLALQQQRQVEIASNLLTNMHHDLASSYTQLCVAFDSVHDLYAQNKKLFTPSQLALWCSAASSGSSAATGSAAGSSVEKGSAHKKSADKKKGAGGGAGGKSLESDDPPANSALNILRRLEAIEAVVAQQFDAHGIAWMELQRALREAANPRDAAAQFQLSKGEPTRDSAADDDSELPSTPSSVSSSASSSMLSPSKPSSRGVTPAAPRSSALAGWFRLPHPAALDSWNERHALVESRAAWINDQWHLLKGKTPREMMASAVWETRTEEEGE